MSVPDATFTQIYGISGSQMVGYSSEGPFVFDGSSYNSFALATPYQPMVRGISGNDVVGYYLQVTGRQNGFLASPVPEPIDVRII